MAYDFAAAVTEIDNLRALEAALIDARAALVALGARPTFPTVEADETDANDIQALIDTYDSDVATAKAVIADALAAVITSKGTLAPLIPANTWVALTGLAVAPTEVWVGYMPEADGEAQYLDFKFLTKAPTAPFPATTH